MVKKAVKSALAKKNAPERGGNHSRTPRKEGYNDRRLARVVERLREQAARIASLAKQMQDTELGQVDVDGHAMLLRGLDQIDNFADNASRAIREASRANRAI